MTIFIKNVIASSQRELGIKTKLLFFFVFGQNVQFTKSCSNPKLKLILHLEKKARRLKL